MDPDSLLALRVNGADLSLDHGYPARVIVPARPWRALHQVGRQPDVPELTVRRFRRWYGANPLNLLVMVGCFVLSGYAAAGLLQVKPVGVPCGSSARSSATTWC